MNRSRKIAGLLDWEKLDRPLRFEPSSSIEADERKPVEAIDQALLLALQANILKGHGRDNTVNLFLEIEKPKAFRAWLADFRVTSAHEQLERTAKFKRNPDFDGDTVRCIGFSAAGLNALERKPRQLFAGHEAFLEGMASRKSLHDPKPNTWDFQAAHVWILLADASLARLNGELEELLATLNSAVTVLRVERGLALRNAAGEGIEHFGYVDGRSQPLFLQDDIDAEASGTGIGRFNPTGQLTQLIIRDPLAPKAPAAAGSFLVFRKLEQHVKAFKEREEALADQLNLEGEDRERAGAMIVGRFEDGTPLAQSGSALGLKPGNNFDYSDRDGKPNACPVHAHIRKTNPRTAKPTDPNMVRFLMARRGITYGARENLRAPFPEAGVGLLFAAYMSSIEDQFERAQAIWANTDIDPRDGSHGTGADGVIGQGIQKPQCWATGAGTQQLKFQFADFVRLRAGDYFYAPSLDGIRSLSLTQEST